MKCTISIIGCGHVGSTLAYSLINIPELEAVINLIDIDPKLEGTYLDIAHAAIFNSNIEIEMNKYELIPESDFIFYAAGRCMNENESRLSLTKENKELAISIFSNLKLKKTAYVIVLSNPVDIISYYISKTVALAHKQVIGTGTMIDTARLKFYLNKNSTSLVLGEHGDSMVFVKAKTENFEEWEDAKRKTLSAAKIIKKWQGATYYAVSTCAVEIFKSIHYNSTITTEASVKINAHWSNLLGLTDIYISLPVKINAREIEILSLQLSENEMAALKNSALLLQKHK
jgi:L-lactate dehydrogenase